MHSEEEQAHAVESARNPILNYRVALHEAGHALIAAYLRLPFRTVTIVPNLAKGYDGCVLTRPWRVRNPRFIPLFGGTYETRERRKQRLHERVSRKWECEIACFLGGNIAEQISLGSDCDGSGPDEQSARDIARGRLKIPEEKIESFIEEARKRTKKILEIPFMRWALDSVADRLETDKTLTYRRVREIYENERVSIEIGIQFRRDWNSEHPGTGEVRLSRLYSDYCRWCRSEGVIPLWKSVFYRAAFHDWKYIPRRKHASRSSWAQVQKELAEITVA